MGEETGVRRGGGRDAPAEFLWRGQLHRVRTVLDHRRTRPVPPEDSDSSEEAPGSRASRAGGAGSPDPGSDRDQDSRDQDSRGQAPGPGYEIWRVRAAIGRAGRPGVFDLRFDWNDGRWTVIRIDTLEGDL